MPRLTQSQALIARVDITRMTDVPALPVWAAGLLQLASPALPIGAFSYSQGLEQANAQGWVIDESSAKDWISSQWWCAFAPRELHALQNAFEASDLHSLLEINDEFLASRDTQEVRAESLQTGSSLMRWLRTMQAPLELGSEFVALIAELQNEKLTAPIAFSLCAKAQGLPLAAARLAWGWSWLENQVQAAVKIVPLGQTAGQRLLIALRPLLASQSEDPAWAFSPLGSIASMRHERLYTRIFRS
jgi:urease accessory protein